MAMRSVFGVAVLLAGLTAAADFEAMDPAIFSVAPDGGGGALWADLDGDGFPDLVVNGRIYRNEGGKRFRAVELPGAAGGTAVAADFNGDGHLDLFFPATTSYWLGDGAFHFTPGEIEPGPHQVSLGAAAADFDGDGWVDLYVSGFEDWDNNRSFPDYRYRNDHGVMKLVWQSEKADTMRCHGGVSVCDFDADGAPDIYVGNYRLQPNQLWVNQKDGTFKNLAHQYGVAGSEHADLIFRSDTTAYSSCGHTIGVNWADFDNDGAFDLFVCNFAHPPVFQDRSMFLRNEGKHFADRSADAALRWQESYAGSSAADYDNDGRVDLFLTTAYPGDRGVLLHNDGDWHFAEATGAIDSVTTYQAAWGDFDNDGRLDLLTGGKLYRNVTAGGNCLRVALADPTSPNTAAIGAVVRCLGADNVEQIRQVEAGTGAGCQNDPVLHFGLGAAEQPPVLEVRWPDGVTEVIHPEQLNTTLKVVRKSAPAPKTKS